MTYPACRIKADLGLIWSNLRFVTVSGEECHWNVVEMFRSTFPQASLINLYGSTEVSGDITFEELYSPDKNNIDELSQKVSIGLEMPNNYLFVVEYIKDNNNNYKIVLLPDGEQGELLVVGKHVASGYNNVQEDSKFIINPFYNFYNNNNCDNNNDNGFPEINIFYKELNSDSIIKLTKDSYHKILNKAISLDDIVSYRNAFLMGDIVVRLESNQKLFWLGRKDRQIKIHGVRIELEEVEREICKLLDNINGIAVSSVHYSDDTNTEIILFVERKILEKSGLLTIKGLQDFLKKSLRSSHVPHFIITLESLPLNPSNSKVDRTHLSKLIYDLRVNQDNDSKNIYNNTESSMALNIDLDTSDQKNNLSQNILNIYSDILLKNRVFSNHNNNNNDNENENYSNIDFFSLGGDSFSSVECLWRLRELNGISIRQQDLVKNINDLSDYIITTIQSFQLKKRKYESNNCLRAVDSTINQDNIPNKRVNNYDLKSIRSNQISKSNSSNYHDNNCLEKDNLTLNIKWTQNFKKCIDSSPLLISSSLSEQGVIYIGSHGGDVKAINALTGEVIWSVELGEHIESAISANYAGDVIYVATYSGNDRDGFVSSRNVNSDNDNNNIKDSDYLGAVWALDSQTGDCLWIRRTAGEIKSSPLVDVDDKIIYVGCYDGFLYSLSIVDGVVVNKVETQGSIFSTPVLKVINEVKYICTATTTGLLHLVRVDILGKLQLVDTYIANSAIFSTPYFDDKNDYLIFGSIDGFAHCVSVREKDKLTIVWTLPVADGPIFASLCGIMNDKVIVGSHDGKVRCLIISTGEILWDVNCHSIVFSSPFCCSRYCIICTTAGDVIVIDCENNGNEIIRIKLKGEIYSSPILFNNSIYVGCRDDRLYCIDIV